MEFYNGRPFHCGSLLSFLYPDKRNSDRLPLNQFFHIGFRKFVDVHNFECFYTGLPSPSRIPFRVGYFRTPIKSKSHAGVDGNAAKTSPALSVGLQPKATAL